MQPTSLAVTSTAPRADARDAPAAPALTLAADTRSVRWLEERLLRADGGFEMVRGVAVALLLAVTSTVVVVSGCATRDDSVGGRVETLHSDEWTEDELLEMRGPDHAPLEPEYPRGVPPVVTPGQAKQDSLNELPDEDATDPSSE